MQRSRAGLAGLTAALIVLVAVIATGNQGLTDYFQRHSGAGSRIFRDVRLSINAFPWRFAPRSGQSAIYTGQLVGIAVLVVLTFLLVLAIGRGAVTFGRVFFGTWFAVVTAAVVAVMVRGLFINPQVSNARIQINSNQVAYALFENPGGPGLAFALACGLIVGLVTAIVAVATARPAETPAYPVAAGTDYPADQQLGEQPRSEPSQPFWTPASEETQAYGWPSEQTQAFEAPHEQTQDRPREVPPEEPGGSNPTATLPEVPPDDPRGKES